MVHRAAKAAPVWATVAALAFVLSLFAWAFSSPIGATPDEEYHLASIWCSHGDRAGVCEPGDQPDERRVPNNIVNSPCFAFQPEASAACSTRLTPELTNTARGNFHGDYPPVFYGTMGLFASDDVAASVLVMRAINAVLFAGLLLTVVLLLPGTHRGPPVWGVLMTIVPLGMFLVPSVNPSSWAIISAATLWAALYGYWRAVTTRRAALFGGLAVLASVMGAGARADAAIYTAIAAVVTWVMFAPSLRRPTRAWILPALIIGLAIVAFFSTGDSSIATPQEDPNAAGDLNILGLIAINLAYMPSLIAGALGTWGLGWLDTAMPPGVWVTTVAAFGALLFWGAGRLSRRGLLGVSLVGASIVMIPLYVLVGEGILVGTGVQPRYIYPLMIVLAGLSLTGFSQFGLRLNRAQLAVVGVGIVVANSLALHTNLRRYLTGTDGNGLNLDENKEWWWTIGLSPMTVWFLGSLAFTVAVAIVIVRAWSEAPVLAHSAPGDDIAEAATPGGRTSSDGEGDTLVSHDRGALPDDESGPER